GLRLLGSSLWLRATSAGLHAVAANDDQHGPHRDDLPLLDEDLRHLPGRGRRDLDRRLVGLDLDERIVLRVLLSLGHEPAGDFSLREPFAEVGQLQLVRHQPILLASRASTAWTPLTPFTTCVTRRSTATLASASACRRPTSSSRIIRSSIPSVAPAAARSRSSSNPNVIQPAAVSARGASSRRSSRTVSVSSARVSGHSIAVPDTSPSPWRACPSPAENSAPSTGIGRYSVVPATSSLQSMFPPQRRGGDVECTPGSGGGIPSTPRNGASCTVAPAGPVPVPVAASSDQSIPSPSPKVMPHSATSTASTAISSVVPARAPRISIGPTIACPPSSSGSRSSKCCLSGTACQPASSVAKRTESCESIVR